MVEEVAIRSLADWRECTDCGLFQRLPVIPDGDAAKCARCNALLQRAARDTITFARTCVVIGAALFALALFLPLVDMAVLGRVSRSTVFSGPEMLRERGTLALAIIVFATVIVVPAIKLTLELIVLFGLRLQHPPHWLPSLFRWREIIGPWAMVEVFMLGSFVAYTRLRALAHVDVGMAAVALGGAMLCMVATDATLDREAIWQELEAKTAHSRARAIARKPRQRPGGPTSLIGCEECGRVNDAAPRDRCVRCHHRLKLRKGKLERVWALVATAALLYIPANVLPVMTITRLGRGGPTTILNGVVELAEAHLWPLAILVLLASVIVPVFKLVSIVTMLVMTHRKSNARLVMRTRIFRVVRFIGRWSMIDIFMLAVLVGVVRMGSIASVLPGMGAVAFCGVVVVTMVATEMFDPRLMWDEAGREEEAYLPNKAVPREAG